MGRRWDVGWELLESGERGVGRKIRGDELRAVGNDGGDGAGEKGVGVGGS